MAYNLSKGTNIVTHTMMSKAPSIKKKTVDKHFRDYPLETQGTQWKSKMKAVISFKEKLYFYFSHSEIFKARKWRDKNDRNSINSTGEWKKIKGRYCSFSSVLYMA